MTAPPDPAELPPVSRCEPRPDLPDPLETLDGERVETPAEWADRRAELRRLFRHYVYGYAPDPPEVAFDVERTPGVLDGTATLTEAAIRFPALPDDAPAINLALFVPADDGDSDDDVVDGSGGPDDAGTDGDGVPVVLAPNNAGNHGTVADEAVTITDTAREHGFGDHVPVDRGFGSEYWCVEHLLSRGYGFATFHCADVDPDENVFTDGIHPHFDVGALPGPPGTEWGTIAAWAWGLQRCVDYLRTDDAVRSDAIAVTGHSRLGKTALLAGATDERIGLVAPHQSGTGGCALGRENGQESVADITEAFPHWFADTFAAAAGQVDRLPVDQHLLVACVAPRPLIDTEGGRDYWANPGRALDALQAAGPVYDLLGVDGMASEAPLYGDDEISDATVGRLLQYRRETEHTLNRGYWDAILDFADVHFEDRG